MGSLTRGVSATVAPIQRPRSQTQTGLRQDSDSEAYRGGKETDSSLLTHLLLLDNILKSLSTARQPLAFPFCASRSICNLSCTRWSVGPRVRKPWGAVRCRRSNALAFAALRANRRPRGVRRATLARMHAVLGTTSEDDDSNAGCGECDWAA
jgi:hypothetical protein